MPEYKVSIIMPAYNRGFILKYSAGSLLNQTYSNYEIVVVDDGSTDNTPEIMKELGAASPGKIKYIRQENAGPAGARNTGIKNSTGDVLLFIDSDVISPPELVETHVYYHTKYPRRIVQGQLVRIIDLKEAYSAPFNYWHYSRSFFDTANVSVLKKFVEKAGYFDDKIFKKGWEDLDLGLRLIKIGLKPKRLIKEAFVRHYEGDFGRENILEFFNDRFVEGQASVVFYRKYPTFSVKMMAMIGKSFYWLSDRLFDEEYLKSWAFYEKIKALIGSGQVDKAIATVRYNGYCFHFKGIREKIRQDGYLLPAKY